MSDSNAYTEAEADAALAMIGRLGRLVGRAELLFKIAIADRANGPAWEAEAREWMTDAAATMLSGGQRDDG